MKYVRFFDNFAHLGVVIGVFLPSHAHNCLEYTDSVEID